MWAGAQTTPSVTGPMVWDFGGYTSSRMGFINTTQVMTPGNGVTPSPVNTVDGMFVNITKPQNGEGFFTIAGAAQVFNIASNGAMSDYMVWLPVTGTMIPASNSYSYYKGSNPTAYVATLYVGAGSFTCNLTPSTLNGTCIGNNGLGLNIVYSP